MAGTIYFIGDDTAHGAELWRLAIGATSPSADPMPGAEAWAGPDSSLPHELSAMGDDLFWRAWDPQGLPRWYHLGPTGQAEGAGLVSTQGFDVGMTDEAQRQLGVRAGAHFWGAVSDNGVDLLTAWDGSGAQVAAVALEGTGRHALADTLDAPAYAASMPTLDLLTGQFTLRQQVLAVLQDPATGDWSTVQVTTGGADDNRIDAIVGAPSVKDPGGSGDEAKTIFFAGRFGGAEGLFEVQLRHPASGIGWTAAAPLRLDDIVNGGAPLAPTELLVTGPGVAGLGQPHLFFFGQDAAGHGRIFQLVHDPFTFNAVLQWSSADDNGSALQGGQLVAGDSGVVFSAVSSASGESVVGRYGPTGFFQPFALTVDARPFSPVGQLVADGQGRQAFVESDGLVQTLWLNDAGVLQSVRSGVSPLTGLRLVDGHLVWIGLNSIGTGPVLFDHDIASGTTIEVTSHADADGPGLDGLPGVWTPLAVPGALLFPGAVNAQGDVHLHTVQGGTVTDLGLVAPGAGEALGASWVGSFGGTGTTHGGLVRVTPGAGVEMLDGGPGQGLDFSSDVAVLGTQVLYGQTSPQNTLMVWDASTDSGRAIAFDQQLGAADRVDNQIIYAARDLQGGGVWRINAWDGQAISPLVSLTPAQGYAASPDNPLMSWLGDRNFVGDAQHLYFVALHGALGQELHVLDRSTGALSVIDMMPGASGGADAASAVAFAGGRLFWMGWDNPQLPHLWSTSDGGDVRKISGGGLRDTAGALSSPVAIGSDVYFLGQTQTNVALFHVAADGVAAERVFDLDPAVSPYPSIESLVAIDGDLYWVQPEGVFSQVWRYTPGAAGSAVALTSLPAWTRATGHITQGGDGQIYFSADDETGEELWMVDAAAPGSARRVADLNPGRQGDGYAPAELTPVPDPTEGSSAAEVVGYVAPLPTVHLNASVVRVTEGTGAGQTVMLVMGERVGDLSGTTVITGDFIGIDYTDPVSGETFTAADGADVVGVTLPTNGEVTLLPGMSQFTFGIALSRDALQEGPEAILMRLTAVSGGILDPLGIRQAVALIDDDDATPPLAHPDSLRSPIGQAVELSSSGLLANDEPSSALLDIVGFVDTHGTPDPADDSVVSHVLTNAGNELDLVLHAGPGLDDGSRQSVVLTPSAVPAGSAGGLDSFSYVVRDAAGRESRAEVTWDITNLPPVARPDTIVALTPPGAPGPVVPIASLLANDSDPDGGAVFLASWQPQGSAGGALAPWYDGAGSLQGLIYTAAPGSTSDTFGYAINDGDGSHPTLHGTASGSFSVSLPPPPMADLSMSGTLAAPGHVGDTVQVTLTISNAGPDDGAATVQLILSPDRSLADGLPDEVDPTSLLWTPPVLAAGSSHSLVLPVRIGALGPGLLGAVIASATRLDPDSTPGLTSISSQEDDWWQTVLTGTRPEADLSLSGPVQLGGRQGDTVMVTLSLTNDGPEATSATVQLLLSPGRSLGPDLPPGVNPLALTWTVPSIEPGAVQQLTLPVHIDTEGPGGLGAAVVLASAFDPDSTPAPFGGPYEDDTWITDMPGAPALKADLSVSGPATVSGQVGDTVPVTLTVANAGPDAGAAVVQIILSPDRSFGPTLPAEVDPATGLWTVPTLAAGASHSLTLPVRLGAEGSGAVAAVIVSAMLPDPDSTPGLGGSSLEDDRWITTLQGNLPPPLLADLSMSGPLEVPGEVGDTVQVTLTVTNAGPEAGAATVQVILSAGRSFGGGLPAEVDASGLWTMPELAPGTSRSITLPVRIDAVGSGALAAFVASATRPDPDSTPGQGGSSLDDDWWMTQMPGSVAPPAPQPPALVGAAEVQEGRTWALSIGPAPAGAGTDAVQIQVDWGDGSGVSTLSGAELAAANGVMTHTFADDDDGHVNRSPKTVQVTVTDPVTGQSAAEAIVVDVVDAAPTIGSFGFAVPTIEHHTSIALTVGPVIDAAGDPVQQLLVDWGDGVPQPVPLPGPVPHSFDTLGSFSVRASVVNDDGSFDVGRTTVSTTATAGHAAPNGTPAQWAASWTDSLMSVSHKADGDNAAEAWSTVTLSAVNSGALGGGDLYGGLLGVSGQSTRSSGVRQEIDGTEALRIELAPGTRADSLILDVARLFTNDAAGLNEAGTVHLYDGSTPVGSAALKAVNANGRLHVELLHQHEFTSVVFRAGVQDPGVGGGFDPGGMVDASGAWAPAPAGAGSDYLIEALQFMNLPEVPLVGVTSDFGP